MLCCLNPDCDRPINPDDHAHCQNCGVPLVKLLYNRFKVIKRIGEGGFAITYLAEDTHKLNERCVVKQLVYQGQGSWATKKAVELFEQEAKQLQKLGAHPQIPTLIAYFQEGDYLFLVQEFVEGEDLSKQREEQGEFGEAQIRQLLLDLLPVLGFVHSQGVIHRDIKLQNIMRGRQDDKPILIDFGISKLISQTVIGTKGAGASILGSFGYAPLEQMQDGKAVYASDLFALGVTCFHLLSGVHPQSLWATGGYTWTTNWREYVQNPVSAHLGAILDKLMQVEVRNRYQSANEVLQDLQPQNQLSQATQINSTGGLAPPFKRKWTKKSAVLIGTGIAAVAVVGLAIGIPRIMPNPHSTTSEVAELYKLANAKYDRGKYKEALEDINKAISLDSNYADNYHRRGRILDSLGDDNGAIADYNKAISLDANYANPYGGRGIVRLKSGDKQRALEDFNKAIELNPKFARAYNSRGLLYGGNGNLKTALEDFNKAIELDPDNAIFYPNRGEILRKLGDNERALEDHNKAILLDPRLTAAYVNRSIVRESLGDLKGAIEDCDKVIELDPKSYLCYLNRGTYRYVLGDRKGAIEDFSKAIELKPDLNQAYSARALARAALDDKKGAIEDYQKAASFYLKAGRTKDYQDSIYRIKQLQKQ
jgi:serine/threonine protein kinase